MNRAILSMMTGLWGGATMLAMFWASQDRTMIAQTMVAAAVAGLATAPMFGKPHPIWGLVSAVLTTSLGAALVGAWMGYPDDAWGGLIVAPLLVWIGITGQPQTLLVWLLGAAALRLTGRMLNPETPTAPPIP